MNACSTPLMIYIHAGNALLLRLFYLAASVRMKG